MISVSGLLHGPPSQLPTASTRILWPTTAHSTWILVLILLMIHTLVDCCSAVTAITVIRHTPLSVLLLLLNLPDLVKYPPISVKNSIFKVSQTVSKFFDEMQLVVKPVGLIAAT